MGTHKITSAMKLTFEEFNAEVERIQNYMETVNRVYRPSCGHAKVVKMWPMVRLMRGEGMTWQMVARTLFERFGVKSPKGKPVSTQVLLRAAREIGVRKVQEKA